MKIKKIICKECKRLVKRYEFVLDKNDKRIRVCIKCYKKGE